MLRWSSTGASTSLVIVLSLLVIIASPARTFAQSDGTSPCTSDEISSWLLDVIRELGAADTHDLRKTLDRVDKSIEMLENLRQVCAQESGVDQVPDSGEGAETENGRMASSANSITLENVRQITQQKTYSGAGTATVSPDGSLIALSLPDTEEIILRSIETDAIIETLPGRCSDMAFGLWSPSENRSSPIARTYPQSYNAETGIALLSLQRGTMGMDSRQTQSRILVCAGANWPSDSTGGFLQVWDLDQGGQLAIIEQGFTLMLLYADLRFSHDGTMMAVADGVTAQVWDTRNWTRIAQFPIGDIGSSVSLSPDGQYLAGSSWDGSARVWDLRTGNTRFLLRHKGAVEQVLFSHDGSVLFTAERCSGKGRERNPRVGWRQRDRN